MFAWQEPSRVGKSNVQLFRNWAEHSEWVRAAINVRKTQISSAEWDIVPYDKEKSTFSPDLAAKIKSGDLRIHSGDKWEPSTWPKEAKGYGFHEAPRGALCHWIVIKDGKVANYQAVVPGGWNSAPRDAKGQRGPYEQALVGTPLKDPNRPLEILRTIHSFDPCMACAIHVVDPNRNELFTVKSR